MDEKTLSEIEARAKSAQSGPWLVCAAEDAADGLPVAFFGRGSGPKDVAVRSDGPPSLSGHTTAGSLGGYAVTIHKSQGMSLDRASVNLDGSFERGLAYVALSRVRSPEGLNLESRRMGSLEAHPKFLRFVRERGLS